QIVKEETALYIKSKLNVQAGRIYLTNKRLVFIKSMNPMFGLIGLLAKVNRGGLLFDIPRKDITRCENLKYGLNKKVMGLTLVDGQEIKFIISSDYTTWEGALK
ncbi:MAG: hypothetical protein Q8P27_00125, partial [Candidatus Peregrinibacteria bacterium]|nr:hypothetical protein [Candidatus Peregrinibacteria bacterium]